MTLLLLFAALNGIDRPTFILAEQQQQQQQQQPAIASTGAIS